jgi:hypothetical protein
MLGAAGGRRAAAAAALLAGAAVAGCGGGGGRTAPAAAPPGPFARLQAGPAPAGWPRATISSGAATLAYPAGWTRTTGDAGTVSADTVDRRGAFRGYLNLTPQQGAETLAGWAAFRVARNREEGSTAVRTVAAAERLRFRGASGSCVIDDYRSRVGGHPYRELACIVAGRTATVVLIGAAPPADWATNGRLIERAASALVVR